LPVANRSVNCLLRSLRRQGERSTVGSVLAAVSLMVMPGLSYAQRRTGPRRLARRCLLRHEHRRHPQPRIDDCCIDRAAKA
jgi:hypothetical protein